MSHSPNATTNLCFDGMLGGLNYCKLIFINPIKSKDIKKLSLCDAAIIVRHVFLDGYAQSVEFCRSRGIRHYLLTDDNFVSLSDDAAVSRDESHVYAPYNLINYRIALKSFSGVLSSTQNLTTFFLENNLHHKVEHFSVVTDSALGDPGPRKPHNSLHLGFFGGGFRIGGLRKIIPALEAFSKSRAIRLFGRDNLEKFRTEIECPSISLETIKLDEELPNFIRRYQKLDIDAVIHPGGVTKNISYKTANAVLVSRYLGAVPILTKEPAYENITQDDGCLFFDGTSSSLAEALTLVADEEVRLDMLNKLERFCQARFSPEQNHKTLRTIAAYPKMVSATLN